MSENSPHFSDIQGRSVARSEARREPTLWLVWNASKIYPETYPAAQIDDEASCRGSMVLHGDQDRYLAKPEERSFSTRAPIAGNMNFRKGSVSGSGRKRSLPSRIACRMTCDRFAHFPFFLGFYQIIAFVFSKSKAIVSACSEYASDPAPGCRSSKQSILRITGHASLEEHQLTEIKHTTPAAGDFLRHWGGNGQRVEINPANDSRRRHFSLRSYRQLWLTTCLESSVSST
ncbi:hypothetical protein J2Z50_003399 [Ensifer mexicanus]|nr:hypothetical protein [Sinorhizobium mexicanum]